MKKIWLLVWCGISFMLTAQVPRLIDHDAGERITPDEPVDGSKQGYSYSDSLRAVYYPYVKITHRLYKQYVYEPAFKNTSVSKENIDFLKALEFYLRCRGKVYWMGIDKLPIFPVYRFLYKEQVEYTSIFTHFPFMEEYQHEYWNDTVLHQGLMKSMWYVYFSNYNKPATYNIKSYNDFLGVCDRFRTFILYPADSADTRLPAFAVPYKLDLQYVNDTILNKALEKYNEYNNTVNISYCDGGQPQIAFARLRHIPYLYFTTDAPTIDAWGPYYPTRGIYLRLSSSIVIPLFEFKVEMVECSCI